MNNIKLKKIIWALLSIFSVLLFFSCQEEDDSIIPSTVNDITVEEFLSTNTDREYLDYYSATEIAFLPKSVVEAFELGALLNIDQVNSALAAVDSDISEAVKAQNMGNFSKSVFVKETDETVTENRTLSDVINQDYSIKASTLDSLNIYLREFKIEKDRQQAIENDLAAEESREPNTLIASAIPFASFDIDNDDVYNIRDLLSSKRTQFTVFVSRTIPEVKFNAVVGDPRPALGNRLLKNILPTKVNFDDLNGEFLSIDGTSLVITDGERTESVLEEGAEEAVEVVIPTKFINTDAAYFSPIYKNIDAKSNGFIHEITTLLE